ncbi:MAG: glutathione S-transferase N-terminal domain-containing protein [Methylobacteriaceae bacterium]|nr:glutathione S-transferase N-terminal domain-containing protein [Methylobacteriaceae bacterium]
MKLLCGLTSPFVRKVRIVAALSGLADRIELVPADPMNPDDQLRVRNPLGKVPALALDDGTTIYDSSVICQYLIGLSGNAALLPAEPAARARVLTLEALGDGLLDALILQRYEVIFREPAMRSQRWTDHQAGKTARALAALEAAPPAGPPDLGQIAVACALGYLDFRFEGAWRAGHPRLVAWLDAFAARTPAWAAAAPPPA